MFSRLDDADGGVQPEIHRLYWIVPPDRRIIEKSRRRKPGIVSHWQAFDLRSDKHETRNSGNCDKKYGPQDPGSRLHARRVSRTSYDCIRKLRGCKMIRSNLNKPIRSNLSASKWPACISITLPPAHNAHVRRCKRHSRTRTRSSMAKLLP